MKKLIATFALMGCSFGLIAQPATLPLQPGQMLNASAVNQVVLKEGETRSNVWFSIETKNVEGTSTQHLSNCTLSTDIKLNSGQFSLQSKQLRCISEEGDVFTDKNINAQLLTSTSEICTAKNSKCTEVTLSSSNNYAFKVKNQSNLVAEFNAMREVNKSRLEQSN